jgi:hypothetical protein
MQTARRIERLERARSHEPGVIYIVQGWPEGEDGDDREMTVEEWVARYAAAEIRN